MKNREVKEYIDKLIDAAVAKLDKPLQPLSTAAKPAAAGFAFAAEEFILHHFPKRRDLLQQYMCRQKDERLGVRPGALWGNDQRWTRHSSNDLKYRNPRKATVSALVNYLQQFISSDTDLFADQSWCYDLLQSKKRRRYDVIKR